MLGAYAETQFQVLSQGSALVADRSREDPDWFATLSWGANSELGPPCACARRAVVSGRCWVTRTGSRRPHGAQTRLGARHAHAHGRRWCRVPSGGPGLCCGARLFGACHLLGWPAMRMRTAGGGVGSLVRGPGLVRAIAQTCLEARHARAHGRRRIALDV